jgi:hypothetical protein
LFYQPLGMLHVFLRPVGARSPSIQPGSITVTSKGLTIVFEPKPL